MANDLVQPEKFFLNRFGMNDGALEQILGSALERVPITPIFISNIAVPKDSALKNQSLITPAKASRMASA